MIRTALFLSLLFAAPHVGAQQALEAEVSEFNMLRGWSQDDHAAALSVFVQTCPDLNSDDWQTLCAIAQHTDDGKAFFEAFFKPVLIKDGADPLFTGYFEPELLVSRYRTADYSFPIYRAPKELPKTGQWLTRQQIQDDNVLSGRGLEIAWASDPGDVFFCKFRDLADCGSRMVTRFASDMGDRTDINIDPSAKKWFGAGFTTNIRYPRLSSKTGFGAIHRTDWTCLITIRHLSFFAK